MLNCLMTPEEKQLQDEARAFVREDVTTELLRAMDADEIRYPREFIEKAAARNLLGLRFPKEYGGRGMPWSSEIVALEEVGVLGTSLGCLYSLVSIVGEAINKFGSEHLKEKYLRPTIAGKLTAAEALTEPRGGSDFFGATTTARREGDYYILNGQKRFVVGAEGADYFMVYARTGAPDAPPHESISTFIVDRGPGVEVKHVYGLMGTRGGGTGRLLFKDCRVPAENLLGKENMGGLIFYQMMIPERMTSAAGAVGMGRAAMEVAARYSTRRKAFGEVIQNFQAVNMKVAEMITLCDISRGLIHIAAKSVDTGEPSGKSRRYVSEAKKTATENAWKVVNHAMQIMGGIGYTNIFPIEKMLRDVRLIMIWTGTNEIMDLIIQHEFYKEFAEQKNPARNIEIDALEADREEEKVYE